MASKKWYIKDILGRVEGPLSEEEIIRWIKKNKFDGNETISVDGETDWKPIGEKTTFNEHLLKSFLGDSEDISDQVTTFEITPVEKKKPEEQNFEPEQVVTVDEKTYVWHDEEKTEVAENKLIKKKEKKKKPKDKNSSAISILMLFVFLGLGLIFFLDEETKKKAEFRFVKPEKFSEKLSESEALERKRRAFLLFFSDQFSAYIKSQNEFVQIIEGRSNDSQAWWGLCLTYLELWPYSAGDAKNLGVVNKVAHQALKKGAGNNPYDSTCRIIYLIISDEYEKAITLVNVAVRSSDLDLQADLPFFFFYFRALYHLKHSGEYELALEAIKRTISMQELWIKPYMIQAEIYEKLSQYKEAAKLYEWVLRKNPKHKKAMIHLGLLESKYFKNKEKARKLFLQAAQIKKRVPNHSIASMYLDLAEISIYNKNMKEALKYAEKSYEHNPLEETKSLLVELGGTREIKNTRVSAEGLIHEADQLVKDGNCSQAFRIYEKVFKKNRKNGIVATKAGKCLWKLHFVENAIKWLNLAIKADPRFIESYITLAEFYTERFDFSSAVQTLKAAQRVQKDHYAIFRGYAALALKQNDPESAVIYARKAIKTYAADIQSYIILGKSYILLNDLSNLEVVYGKLISLDPNNEEAVVFRAKKLYKSVGFENAIQYLVSFIRKYPTAITYRVGLAEIFWEERYCKGKPGAMELYREVLEVDPENKKAFLGLSQCLIALGHLEQAQVQLLNLKRVDPMDANPYYVLGKAFESAGKYADAAEEFLGALKINKHYPLIRTHLGRAYFFKRDYKNALKYAKEGAKLNPQQPAPHKLLAQIFRSQKNYILCTKYYQEAIAKGDTSAANYIEMAVCCMYDGRYNEAEALLDHVKQKESGYAELYYYRGKIYELKNEPDKAIKSYSRYLDLEPGGRLSKRAESTLQRLRGGSSKK